MAIEDAIYHISIIMKILMKMMFILWPCRIWKWQSFSQSLPLAGRIPISALARAYIFSSDLHSSHLLWAHHVFWDRGNSCAEDDKCSIRAAKIQRQGNSNLLHRWSRAACSWSWLRAALLWILCLESETNSQFLYLLGFTQINSSLDSEGWGFKS